MKTKMSWFYTQIVLTFFASVNAVGFHGFHFEGLREPEWIGLQRLAYKWIKQPVDHFNHRDNRTWLMRYFEEDKYFNGSGPVFIMLGGEWTINPGFLRSGLMHDIAKQHGALMFYTEHRYYGNSKPTENMSSDNMQYLNVDQALADIAYFIDNIKSEKNIRNSKVIVFGGSYAGNMAAWIRVKYPHLIQGAVASSAPVRAKADFYEYYEVVTESLKRYDPACPLVVQNAFNQVEELLLTAQGSKKISASFNLCEKLDVSSKKDVNFFMIFLAEIFAGNVQYNKFSNGKSKIGEICDILINSNISESIDRLAYLVRKNNNSCSDVRYSKFVEEMKTDSWGFSASRQWYFQTCTEFGYYQTTNSSKSAFGTLFKLDFYVDACTDIFGSYYERALVEYGVNRTNIVYGGDFPDVKNVIFVNGDIDPWHALSILHDLNEYSQAILISGSSHCQDLQADSVNDIPELKAARIKIKEIVSSWVQN